MAMRHCDDFDVGGHYWNLVAMARSNAGDNAGDADREAPVSPFSDDSESQSLTSDSELVIVSNCFGTHHERDVVPRWPGRGVPDDALPVGLFRSFVHGASGMDNWNRRVKC